MSDQTIFNGENKEVTPQNQGTPAGVNPQNANPYADLLKGIVNENGAQKYNSVEELAKGAANAQEFIKQILAEKRELEAKVAQANSAQSKQEELERTVQELLNKTANISDQNKGLSQEEIAELVNRTLTQRDTQQSAKQNQQTVVAAAAQAFGTDAEKKYIEAAQEAGLTVEEMNQLAAKSPKAVLKMLGVTGQPAQKQGTTAPGSSAVNTAGFTPSQESYVKRNDKAVQIGATTSELQEERIRSNKMVEELHAAGLSVHDLTNPKVYKKYFG